MNCGGEAAANASMDVDGPLSKHPVFVLRRAELGSKWSRDRWKDDPTFVSRLAISRKLPVHSGCVNTIVWSDDGSLILSGSDDANLVITNPFLYNPVQHRIASGHVSNIFSARFLPATQNSIVISCASEGNVILSDVERTDTHGSFIYSCTGGNSTYEVCPLVHSPFCFLSCGEDGAVRLYDRREKTSCTACKKSVLIDCKRPISAMDMNSVRPDVLAVGCADSIIRLYDVRYTNHSFHTVNCIEPVSVCCQSAGSLNRRVTSLEFDPTGQSLLASISCHHVCLYDLLNNSACAVNLCGTNDAPSPGQMKPKRIRLRGDWSDTGPAISQQHDSNQGGTPGEEAAEPTGPAAIIQHFGRVLNNWYQRNIAGNVDNDNEEQTAEEHDEQEDNNERNDSSASRAGESATIGVSTSGTQLSTVRMQMHDESASRDSSDDTNLEEEPSEHEENREDRRGRLLRMMAEEARKQREERDRQLVESLNTLPQKNCVASYKGHRNARTMMKQANFWGQDYIMSGSDCGHIIIWNRHTRSVVGALQGDSRVVNCVQPHHTLPILATSGIDYDIKIWSPCLEEPVQDKERIKKLLERNELMLNETMDTVSIPAAFMFRIMAQMHRNRDERRAEQRRAEAERAQSNDDC